MEQRPQRDPVDSCLPQVTSLGEFFKAARERQGRNREEVAESVGVNITQLDEYEADVREIPFDMVFALSNVLNIRPDEVIRIVQGLSETVEVKRRSFLRT